MNRSIPIVRRTLLADNTLVSSIIGSTKPGAKKLQFPFEIPTISTSNDVNIPSGTSGVLIGTASILAVAILGSAFLKYKANH